MTENTFSNQKDSEFKLPEVFDYDFNKSDKKWLKKDADITDYFNFGFNEETFCLYSNRVKLMYE